jgi:hypothetical protein
LWGSHSVDSTVGRTPMCKGIFLPLTRALLGGLIMNESWQHPQNGCKRGLGGGSEVVGTRRVCCARHWSSGHCAVLNDRLQRGLRPPCRHPPVTCLALPVLIFHIQRQTNRSVCSLAAKQESADSPSQLLNTPIRFLIQARSSFEINGTLYRITFLQCRLYPQLSPGKAPRLT